MSMHSSASGGGIPLKLFLERRRRPSTHRVRGVETLSELVGMVRELWPAARDAVVQYDDEDGDRITISMEREWMEALRLHAAVMARTSDREVPLRLHVRRCGGKASGRDSCSLQAPVHDDGGDSSDAPAPPCSTPPLSDSGECEDGPRGCTLPPCTASESTAEAQCCGDTEIPARYLAGDSDRRVLALLSALYACDAAVELLAEEPSVDFGGVVQRCCDASTGRVEVDVQMDALAHAAHVAALTLLDELDPERAAGLLGLACDVFPHDATMQYNAACALAMCGRRSDALDALECATRLGYRDSDRMMRDPDLASLHGEERFGAIVRSLQAAQLSVHAPRSWRVHSAAPSPAVRRLRSVFPSLSVAQAEDALRRCNGNMHAAVESLLGSV